MRRIYKYLSLVGAKLVGRRHDRDVDLPGMKELLNAFVSKSDGAITARPDFNPVSEDLLSVGSQVGWGASDNTDDYLNSVSGMYGTDSLVYLSRVAPVMWDGANSFIACDTESTGTITVSAGEFEVRGTDTEWIKEAWPGCLIEFAGDGIFYVIESVTTDKTLTTTKAVVDAHTASSYTIYHVHQADHANYKLNIQPFTSGIIYSCPTITLPIDPKKICGPFYARMEETAADIGWVREDLSHGYQLSSTWDMGIAASVSEVMLATASSATDDPNRVSYSDGFVKDPSNWVERTLPAGFEFESFQPCVASAQLTSEKYYIGGRDADDGNKLCVAVTGDGGATWTKKTHPSATGYVTGIFRLDSNGLKAIAFVKDSYATAYYTEDSFSTWDAISLPSPPSVTDYGYRGGESLGSVFWFLLGEDFVYYYDLTASGGTVADVTTSSNWKKISITAGADYRCMAQGSTGSYYRTIAAFDANAVSPHVFTIQWQSGMSYASMAATLALWETSGITGQPTLARGVVSVAYDRTAGKFVVSAPSGISGTSSEDAGVIAYADSLTSRYDIQVSEEGPSSIWSPLAYCTSPGATVCKVGALAGTSEGLYVSNDTVSSASWELGTFAPLSNECRALTHSVLDGYVMLFGVSEYNSDTLEFEYFPRRIRWTAPLTYNDFSSSGSGTADLDGSGAVLDSRAVNGRIVTFESSAIGAVSPRGYATDPWEYDKIKDNIRAVSNPVVVDDMCYFIDDSGLLRATNGVSVESPPFSFDLTEYDDFNADKPIWLTYAPDVESLCIYNPSDSNRYIYFVETESGTVTRFQAAAVDGEDPKSVVCVEGSDDRRMMVSFNPIATDTDTITVAESSTGNTITGFDEWTSSAGDDTYHNTDVQTPQVFIVPEGGKTGLKHLIVNTYTDGTSEATNPILVVQCKSLEDEAWHDNGDRNGTITVTDTVCTGSETAWSNALSTTNSPTNTTYDTPCLATQARVYVGSSPQTLGIQYTITGTKEITFGSDPGDTVYAYWENNPEVVSNAGDLIQTTEGWHRVSSFDTATTATLDHYMSTGETDATATHHHGTPFPVGEGQIKIGISKLVEGVKLRFLIFHRDDGDATVTKITGVSVGHIPAGEKIVEV